jgi:hypothetical protein
MFNNKVIDLGPYQLAFKFSSGAISRNSRVAKGYPIGVAKTS